MENSGAQLPKWPDGAVAAMLQVLYRGNRCSNSLQNINCQIFREHVWIGQKNERNTSNHEEEELSKPIDETHSFEFLVIFHCAMR